MNPLAIIMCGVPAAGKTTIRSMLVKALLPQTEFEIIAPDDMIDVVSHASGAFYRDIYCDEAARQVCYDAAWYRYDRAIRAQKNVIVDRTHLAPSHRAKTLHGGVGSGSNRGGLPLPALLPLYRCIAVTIDLPGSVHDWIARIDGRPGKAIPAHTLFGMVRSFTPPTVEEGFEAVFQGASESDVAERAAAYIRENTL